MSDPVIVIARAQVPAENRARFIASAHDCITLTRHEQGCLAYDMYESATEPGRFIVLESWETRADVDRHMRQPHLVAFLDVAGTCVSAPPVIEVLEPRSVDRL